LESAMFIYSMPSQRAVDAARALEPIKEELDAARAAIARMYARRNENVAEWAKKLGEQFGRVND
jgi:hypothetical protein